MKKASPRKKLTVIFRALLREYGPQGWWPGDSPFEVMVGAVLTQNTAWSNVEKAIVNLKHARALRVAPFRRLRLGELAGLIRPSGYYNIKAKRLVSLMDFLGERYGGSLTRMFRDNTVKLREGLLSVNGIGPETADSIMLYAGGHPVFVVDAYTKRVLLRHGLLSGTEGYHEVQRLFVENLPQDPKLFNEYHALLVLVGKRHCRKSAPRCDGCPLKPLLKHRVR
ncbi:MAG TPA: endonuclease III domain-containing protein [Nitrospirota bacterium]|nr:endonuclease III domain-containing protein [Nitrospirota bacterium]